LALAIVQVCFVLFDFGVHLGSDPSIAKRRLFYTGLETRNYLARLDFVAALNQYVLNDTIDSAAELHDHTGFDHTFELGPGVGIDVERQIYEYRGEREAFPNEI
jgi:hypothetical protein